MGMMLLFALVIAIVVGFFALQIWARTAPPSALGTENGELMPCPDSPNCVSSYATDEEHGTEPLELRGESASQESGEASSSSARDAIARARAVVESMPRTRITEERADYLAAEFRSSVFGFVDDVEFLADEASGRLHIRSASRLGYSDMGANRERVEEIRRRYNDM